MEWAAPQHAAIFDCQQQGKLWLHRYEPPVPSLLGWHFVADQIGTASFLQLLVLFQAAVQPIERSIRLRPKSYSDYHPIREPKLKRHLIVSPASLKVSIDLDGAIVWRMIEEPDRLTLEMNRSGLDQLRGGVLRYQDKRGSGWPGDYSVGPDARGSAEMIWFW